MDFLIEGVLTLTVKLKSPRKIPRFSALSFRSSLQLLILGLIQLKPTVIPEKPKIVLNTKALYGG